MLIQIVTQEADAYVKFRYDESVIAMVRRMPNREWDRHNKVWWFDADDARTLATLLHRMGHEVFLDDVEFKPLLVKTNGQTGNVFETFFDFLPGVLRAPMYRAQSKILHPDLGGDNRLMQMLNDAYEKYREN